MKVKNRIFYRVIAMLLIVFMVISPFADIQTKADTTTEVKNTDATVEVSDTNLGKDVKTVL
ncbi:MAG: hypothetical protein WCD89_04400 [Anaerocolumna sp.]